MTVTAVTIKPPSQVQRAIVDKDGIPLREFVIYLLSIQNSFQLFLGDTTAGNVTQPLPLASALPNQEVFAIKTSSDGHTFALSAQGTDTINKQGAWGASTLTIGTAQGEAGRLKSDGFSIWYVF